MRGAVDSHLVIDAFASEFRRYRLMSEKAADQLNWDELRVPLDDETNSVAIIMKHLSGNLRSRWTEPFTTDGEKPWRNRDVEFVDDFKDRDELNNAWRAGWSALESFLVKVSDADLARTLLIRNEPHTLALALVRSCTHAAYHAGQIVQVARVLAARAGREWSTLTIPRGGSGAFNASKGLK